MSDTSTKAASESKSAKHRQQVSRHGIFISYKRKYKHLAGRIYDYFLNRGIDPFIDEQSLRSSESFHDDLEEEITQTPYFLCLLTPDGVKDLMAENYQERVYTKELLTAFRTKRHIIVIAYDGVSYAKLKNLPEELAGLNNITAYFMPDSTQLFYQFMDRLYRDNIDRNLLKNMVNWREYISRNANALILPRNQLEQDYASLENRFGEELVRCVREKRPYTGERHISEVNMACYAANLLFTPDRSMIDRKAYDYGILFNIFTELMRDRDFNLRIIITAPDSAAAQDACDYDRLGNSALEDCEEAVFLGSYANLHRLTSTEPFSTAARAHRFSFGVTECVLPYAIFHIVYKGAWKKYNHVKIDLYSFNIDSSVERRSMIFFENEPDDAANYSFFVNQFRTLRRISRVQSEKLIRENHEAWMAHWAKLSRDLDFERRQDMEFFRREQLESALSKEYRQYLTGHLGRPQPFLQHIEDDTEIGMSYYTEFTADKPHVHPICTEHTYILEGALRMRLLDGNGQEFEFRKGDFFVLPPGTPYVTKNAAGTRVLFVKTPGTNDKALVEPDSETLRWMSAWDVEETASEDENAKA